MCDFAKNAPVRFGILLCFVSLTHGRLREKLLSPESEPSSREPTGAPPLLWASVRGRILGRRLPHPFCLGPRRSRDRQPAGHGHLRAAGLYCERGAYLRPLWLGFTWAGEAFGLGSRYPEEGVPHGNWTGLGRSRDGQDLPMASHRGRSAAFLLCRTSPTSQEALTCPCVCMCARTCGDGGSRDSPIVQLRDTPAPRPKLPPTPGSFHTSRSPCTHSHK